MKISPRKQGKPQNQKVQCLQCGENYLQAIYIFQNKKWIKIGLGCPVCLQETLNK